MLRFIKLSEFEFDGHYGTPLGDIYINADSIIAFKSRRDETTKVYTADEQIIEVMETAEEIVEKLGLTPAVK